MEIDPADVRSSQDLVAFVAALAHEHQADPLAWENGDLGRFLEALAAWIDDSPGYWANLGEPQPDQPDWSWVALSLSAATQYE